MSLFCHSSFGSGFFYSVLCWLINHNWLQRVLLTQTHLLWCVGVCGGRVALRGWRGQQMKPLRRSCPLHWRGELRGAADSELSEVSASAALICCSFWCGASRGDNTWRSVSGKSTTVKQPSHPWDWTMPEVQMFGWKNCSCFGAFPGLVPLLTSIICQQDS